MIPVPITDAPLVKCRTGKWSHWYFYQDTLVCYKGNRYIVPAGYRTNFVSLFRFLWWVFPPHGRAAPAAGVHDYLYEKQITTQEEADRIFLLVMGLYGVPKWQRRLGYWYVRKLGYITYNRFKNNNPQPCVPS